MRTTSTTRRRLTTAALVAAIGLGAATAPGISVAQPIGGTPAKKDCNLLGTRIRNGERGRRGGVEYACDDGKACQVEGGRTTGRCSHAARVRVDVGLGRGQGLGVALATRR